MSIMSMYNSETTQLFRRRNTLILEAKIKYGTSQFQHLYVRASAYPHDSVYKYFSMLDHVFLANSKEIKDD